MTLACLNILEWVNFFSSKTACRENSHTSYKCDEILRTRAWIKKSSEPGRRWSVPYCCSHHNRPCDRGYVASQLVSSSLKWPCLSQLLTSTSSPRAWEPNATFLALSYEVLRIWFQLTSSAPSLLCVCSTGPNTLILSHIWGMSRQSPAIVNVTRTVCATSM